MNRTPLALCGLVMASVPRTVVEYAERVAFENPDEAVLRRWTVPMARLEGVAYLFVARRRGCSSGPLAAVIGLFASLAALLPRQYLRFGLTLAYQNPTDLRVKPWVVPATRVLGVAVAALTALSMRGDRDAPSSRD